MNAKDHWESIYERRPPDQVSWYRPHLERSLEFVERARLAADAAIIDVGGGSSTLVDDLLARGYRNVTVLDISAAVRRPESRERVLELRAPIARLAGEPTGRDIEELQDQQELLCAERAVVTLDLAQPALGQPKLRREIRLGPSALLS